MRRVKVDTYLDVVSFSCPSCCLSINYNKEISLSPLVCPHCEEQIIPPVSELMISRIIRVAFYRQVFTEGV